MSLSLAEIEQQVLSQLPKINKKISPKDYFSQCAVYLKHAGESKKIEDYSTAYANLFAYVTLVEEIMPTHPDIRAHQKEFNFNNDRVAALRKEMALIREKIEEMTSPRETYSEQSPPVSVKTKPIIERRSTVMEKPTLKPTIERRSSVMSPSEKMSDKVIDSIGSNEKIQSKVGDGISKLAKNEKVQGKIADGISNKMNDEKFKRGMGDSIAENTDNQYVKMIAKNEKVQDAIAVSIQKTVGNKELQKKVGDKISDMAQDKETQKKVASGLITIGKGALKGGKVIGQFGIATAKTAYEDYQKEKQEEKDKVKEE